MPDGQPCFMQDVDDDGRESVSLFGSETEAEKAAARASAAAAFPYVVAEIA